MASYNKHCPPNFVAHFQKFCRARSCMHLILITTVIVSMLGTLGGFRQQSLFAARGFLLRRSCKGATSGLSTQIDSASVAMEAAKQLRRGQNIQIRVASFGPLGASVQVNGIMGGLVLQKELAMYRERRNGIDVSVGDILEAYVENVRENGKVDVSLRPIFYSRIEQDKVDVMNVLRAAPGGVLKVGDKSSPEAIAEVFKGMSKRDFKNAAGSLYKDGLIIPDKLTTTLVPKEHLPFAQSAAAQAQAEKRRHQQQQTQNSEGNASTPNNSSSSPNSSSDSSRTERNIDCSVFLGNLPPTIDIRSLITAVHSVILPDNIVSIRLAKDALGVPRGFGYLELAHESLVDEAIARLAGLEVKGRKLRVDYADREKRFRLAAKAGREELLGADGDSGIEPWQTDDEGEGGIYRARQRRLRGGGPIGLPTMKRLEALPAPPRRTSSQEPWSSDGDGESDPFAFLEEGEGGEGSNALALRGKAGALKPFTRRDGAMKVYNRRDGLSGAEVDWEHLDERFQGPAKPSSPVRLDPAKPLPQATLFIGNLSFGVTEAVLRAEIERLVAPEDVASVRIICNRATGESRGFGFVDLYTTSAAERIYEEMHGQEILGRAVKVDDATNH